jgi:hypothetical protein
VASAGCDSDCDIVSETAGRVLPEHGRARRVLREMICGFSCRSPGQFAKEVPDGAVEVDMDRDHQLVGGVATPHLTYSLYGPDPPRQAEDVKTSGSRRRKGEAVSPATGPQPWVPVSDDDRRQADVLVDLRTAVWRYFHNTKEGGLARKTRFRPWPVLRRPEAYASEIEPPPAPGKSPNRRRKQPH